MGWFVHWVWYKMRLFPKKACKKHWKQELTEQNNTEIYTLFLVDSEILFRKRAGIVGVNTIKHYPTRLWLAATGAHY